MRRALNVPRNEIIEPAQMHPGAALEPAPLDLSGMNEELRAFESQAFEKIADHVIEDLGIRQMARDGSLFGTITGYLSNYSVRQRNRAAISALFETTGGDWKKIREVAQDGIRILRENTKDGMSAIPIDHPFVKYLDALGELSERTVQEHSRDALVERGWDTLLDKNLTGKSRFLVVPSLKTTTWGVNIALGIVDWFLINQAIQIASQSTIPGLDIKIDLPEKVQLLLAALGALWVSVITIKHKATSDSFRELFLSKNAVIFYAMLTGPAFVQYAAAVKAGAVSGGISTVATAAEKAGTQLKGEVEQTRTEIDAMRGDIMPQLATFYQNAYTRRSAGHGPDTLRITEAVLGPDVARVAGRDGTVSFAESKGWNVQQFKAFRGTRGMSAAEEKTHQSFQADLDKLAEKYGMAKGSRIYHYIDVVINRNKQKITLENAAEKLQDFVKTAQKAAADTSLPKEMSGGLPELITVMCEMGNGTTMALSMLVAVAADDPAKASKLLGELVQNGMKVTPEYALRIWNAFTHVASDVSKIKEKFPGVKSAFLDIANVLQKLQIAAELKKFTDDLAKIVPEVASLEFKNPQFSLKPERVQKFEVEWGPFDKILTWSMWDRVTKDIPEELVPFVLQSIHEMNDKIKLQTRYGAFGPGPLAESAGLSFEIKRDATGAIENNEQLQHDIRAYLWAVISFLLIGGGVIGVLDKKIDKLTENIDRGNRAARLSRKERRIGRAMARAFRNPIEVGEEVDIYELLTKRGYRLRERDDVGLEIAFAEATRGYAASAVTVEEVQPSGFPHTIPLAETTAGREFLQAGRRDYFENSEYQDAYEKKVDEIERVLTDLRPANAEARRVMLRAIFDHANIRNPGQRQAIEIMVAPGGAAQEPMFRRAVVATYNDYERSMCEAEIDGRLREIANLSAYRSFYDQYLVSTNLGDETLKPVPMTALVAARRAADLDAMIAYHREFIRTITPAGEMIADKPVQPLKANEKRDLQRDLDRVIAQNDWGEDVRPPSVQLDAFHAFRDELHANKQTLTRDIARRLGNIDESRISLTYEYSPRTRAFTLHAYVNNGENPLALVYPMGAFTGKGSFAPFLSDFRRWLADDVTIRTGLYATRVEDAYARHEELDKSLAAGYQPIRFKSIAELRDRSSDIAEFIRLSLGIPVMEAALLQATKGDDVSNEDHIFLMDPRTAQHKNVPNVNGPSLIQRLEPIVENKAFQLDMRRGVVIVDGTEHDIFASRGAGAAQQPQRRARRRR